MSRAATQAGRIVVFAAAILSASWIAARPSLAEPPRTESGGEVAVAGGAHEEAAILQPNVFAQFGLRCSVPFQASVDDVGAMTLLSLNPGWWGPGVRLGVLVELGLAGECRWCSPFDPWFIAGVGANASAHLFETNGIALVADASYRLFGGVRGRSTHAGPIHVPAATLWVWKNLPVRPDRAVDGFRSAIALGISGEAWIGGADGAAALGISAAYVGGFSLLK